MASEPLPMVKGGPERDMDLAVLKGLNQICYIMEIYPDDITLVFSDLCVSKRFTRALLVFPMVTIVIQISLT